MESITGVLVFTTAQRRTQAKNALAKYAGHNGLSTDPVTVDIPAGKYGPGPSLLVLCWFGDGAAARANADAAWADVEAATANFIVFNSFAEQQTGTNSDRLHRIEWQPDGSGGTTKVVLS